LIEPPIKGGFYVFKINFKGGVMKRIILICVFILSNFLIFAQSPDTLWTKTYGGVESDVGKSISQTKDGGYIITGFTESFGSGQSDVWLIKTDSLGNSEWTKTFGTTENDGGNSVIQTQDSGYLIGGYTAGGYEGNGWLIKTNRYGDTLWTRTFTAFPGCRLFSVKETIDSFYIATGYISGVGAGFEDVYLIKTNSKGELIWTKTFGSSNTDFGNCVEIIEDGGYIITGTTSSSINSKLWLIRTNESGDTLWTKKYGGNESARGNCVQRTSDNGFIIVGNTTIGFRDDLWLLRTDENGDTLWTRTFNFLGNESLKGLSVSQTEDGGYIIVGEAYSYVYGHNYFMVVKTDKDGNKIWYKNFPDDSFSASGYSVQQTLDDDYVVVGSKFLYYNEPPKNDLWLIKIKNSFVKLTYPYCGEQFVIGDSLDITWISDNVNCVKIDLSTDNGLNWSTVIDSIANFGFYNWTINGFSPSSECIIKVIELKDSTVYSRSLCPFSIDSVTSIESSLNTKNFSYSLMQNYPNPFNPTTTIKYSVPQTAQVLLKIFNPLGEEIETLVGEEKLLGTYEVNWNASELASGVYFYRLQAGSFVQTRKMILIK
jgi:hypothetical protein